MLKVKERGDRLYLEGTIDGIRIRESTGLPIGSEAAARTLRDQRVAEAKERSRRGPTIEEAYADYVKRPEGIGATSATYCRQFAQSKWGKKRSGEIDLGQVYREYATKGRAPETIRRELGAIQAMLNWIGGLHQMESKFFIPKPPKGEERLRFLEPDEVRAMVEAAEPWFRPMVVALFYTGLRRSEAARLRWSDVKNGSLLVSTRKGKGARRRWRTVELHPEVVKALGKPGRANEHVFTDDEGRSFENNVTRINKLWAATAEKAGIEDCIPHDARRTFASRLLEAGVDLRTIADLLGHTKLDLLMLYAQVRAPRRRKSVEMLPGLKEESDEDDTDDAGDDAGSHGV